MSVNSDVERQSVTAALIMRTEEGEVRVLIAERNSGGKWEFPGGKLELGETLEECLAREIKEELGLDIAVNKLFMSIDYDYPDKSIALHAFVCRIIDGRPRALGCRDFAWTRPADLGKYNLLPPDRAIAEKIIGEFN